MRRSRLLFTLGQECILYLPANGQIDQFRKVQLIYEMKKIIVFLESRLRLFMCGEGGWGKEELRALPTRQFQQQDAIANMVKRF